MAIKDLYTDVKAQAPFSGSLYRQFDASQGTGQGRILAPFMCKVYTNALLKELSSHGHGVSINTLRLTSPSFADAIQSSLLTVLMHMCYCYSLNFNNGEIA